VYRLVSYSSNTEKYELEPAFISDKLDKLPGKPGFHCTYNGRLGKLTEFLCRINGIKNSFAHNTEPSGSIIFKCLTQQLFVERRLNYVGPHEALPENENFAVRTGYTPMSAYGTYSSTRVRTFFFGHCFVVTDKFCGGIFGVIYSNYKDNSHHYCGDNLSIWFFWTNGIVIKWAHPSVAAQVMFVQSICSGTEICFDEMDESILENAGVAQEGNWYAFHPDNGSTGVQIVNNISYNPEYPYLGYILDLEMEAVE
jgi:hypothetical protein